MGRPINRLDQTRPLHLKSTSNYIFGKDKPFREWMKKVEETTPLWNTRQVMAWNLDKHYLKDLEAKGVPIHQP